MSKDRAVSPLALYYQAVLDPYTSCDDDDRWVTAIATYRSPDDPERTTREAIRLVKSYGWRPQVDPGCFKKTIDGHQVVLHVDGGDPEGKRPTANLALELYGRLHLPATCFR